MIPACALRSAFCDMLQNKHPALLTGAHMPQEALIKLIVCRSTHAIHALQASLARMQGMALLATVIILALPVVFVA